MAALDGKSEIGIEYRPCIVKLWEETFDTYGNKIILHAREGETCKALFHCWNHRSELYDASPMIGGHPGGQVSGTFAIVEYEDGTVHEVEPQNIRFVDNPMCEYAFPEKNKKPEKCKDTDWHCPECKDGIMQKEDLSQYQYKCDKCGHIEYPGRIEASELEE